jgi:hypothetical protein
LGSELLLWSFPAIQAQALAKKFRAADVNNGNGSKFSAFALDWNRELLEKVSYCMLHWGQCFIVRDAMLKARLVTCL